MNKFINMYIFFSKHQINISKVALNKCMLFLLYPNCRLFEKNQRKCSKRFDSVILGLQAHVLITTQHANTNRFKNDNKKEKSGGK